jgi:hypothetical protein
MYFPENSFWMLACVFAVLRNAVYIWPFGCLFFDRIHGCSLVAGLKFAKKAGCVFLWQEKIEKLMENQGG